MRCAIYTRKSTEEGLEQELNSLHVQREAAEAYIASQQAEGWECLAKRYDDGGFSGGNMERPGLAALLEDIKAGEVDAVVVHKVDRLSRSLLDFAKMMSVFEQYGVAFVSVTQQFNTANSMGRLILNVLFSFAQFEREMISERTREKMGAARRKGKWLGGRPILGYDADRERGRLVINELEAKHVRQAFAWYLEHKSLLKVAELLNEAGWLTKKCQTKAGVTSGGQPFNKQSVRNMLTNVCYIGKVCCDGDLYSGEHEAIIDEETFNAVADLLKKNRTRQPTRAPKQVSILQGLLYCQPCDTLMIPTHATKGNKRYRYYTCQVAQKRGHDNCQSSPVAADEIETFVLEQLAEAGLQPAQSLTRTKLAEWLQKHVVRIDYNAAESDITITLLDKEQAA